MINERPSLLTTGSTVSAAENIVAWLKPELLNEPQQNKPDRVSVIERHIGQFSTPAEVKTYLSDRDGCIRLAALRVRNIRAQAGGTVGDITWAAYVMATDAWGMRATPAARYWSGSWCAVLSSAEPLTV